MGDHGSLVSFLLEVYCQLKIYHWQTERHVEHMASDDLIERLEELTDQLIEIIQGKFRVRIKLQPADTTFQISNIVTGRFSENLSSVIKGINESTKHLTHHDDILNIVHEIVGALEQAKYVASFRT